MSSLTLLSHMTSPTELDIDFYNISSEITPLACSGMLFDVTKASSCMGRVGDRSRSHRAPSQSLSVATVPCKACTAWCLHDFKNPPRQYKPWGQRLAEFSVSLCISQTMLLPLCQEIKKPVARQSWLQQQPQLRQLRTSSGIEQAVQHDMGTS